MTAQKTDPIKLAVCVSGGGTTLANLITCIHTGTLNATITHVIASKPHIPAITIATTAGIPTTVTKHIYPPIIATNPDLIVLAGYLSYIETHPDYTNKIINIHPALLPSFGGRGYYGHKVHTAVLAAGVKITGCTVHFIDEEYDHGPIILQHPVPVLDNDTPNTLATRVFIEECKALPMAITLYQQGKLHIIGKRVIIQ